MSIQRKLDIEAALRFAYRDEIPKRGNAASTSLGSSFHLVTKVGTLGTMIDEPMSEPGFPAALGDPHPDALVIEQAVRGLGAIREATLDDDSILTGLEGFSLDPATYIARAMQNVPALVAIHARLGNRPSWGGKPEVERLLGDNGKPVIFRDEPIWLESKWEAATGRNGRATTKPVEWVEMHNQVPTKAIRAGLYPTGSYCCLVWSPRPEMILLDRAEYAVWWAALDYLADELAGELDSIALTPVTAPQRPWLGERDRLVTIHVRSRIETKSMAVMA